MDLQQSILSTISDICCIAEIGGQGLLETEVEKESFDALFTVIREKAETLREQLDYINVKLTEKERNHGT